MGWIGGYFASAEAIAQRWTRTTGLAALLCGAVCAVFLVGLVQRFEAGGVKRILQSIFNRASDKGE